MVIFMLHLVLLLNQIDKCHSLKDNKKLKEENKPSSLSSHKSPADRKTKDGYEKEVRAPSDGRLGTPTNKAKKVVMMGEKKVPNRRDQEIEETEEIEIKELDKDAYGYGGGGYGYGGGGYGYCPYRCEHLPSSVVISL